MRASALVISLGRFWRYFRKTVLDSTKKAEEKRILKEKMEREAADREARRLEIERELAELEERKGNQEQEHEIIDEFTGEFK